MPIILQTNRYIIRSGIKMKNPDMTKWPHILNNMVIFLLFASSAFSSEKNIKIDYCNYFTLDSSVTTVEIYLSFANNDLKFIKTDSSYIAEAEIAMILYDEAGNFVRELSSDQAIHEVYYNMTLNENSGNCTFFKVKLKQGDYRLHVYFTDKTSNHTKKIEKEITVRSIDNRSLCISDIQIASIIEASEEKSNFVKHGKKIIPNTDRTFNSNYLYAEFYFEIYNLSMQQNNEFNSFTFCYQLLDEDNNIITESSNRFSKPDRISAINFSVPTRLLETGGYQLSVQVIDNDSKMTASRNTIFYIDKTTLADKIAEDDEMLDILNNISNRGEISRLKKASGLQRKRALANFWRSKDPSPATPENEFMIEFYTRLNYVNKAFSLTGQKGWKTDRGRIFLRYGTPDKISRSNEADEWERTETWHYFDKNSKFIFIDQFGYGDYKLIEHGYATVVE